MERRASTSRALAHPGDGKVLVDPLISKIEVVANQFGLSMSPTKLDRGVCGERPDVVAIDRRPRFRAEDLEKYRAVPRVDGNTWRANRRTFVPEVSGTTPGVEKKRRI